ncbi:MAG: hypothetical protein LBH21_03560 [Gracilibacteraceae bacterium]|jgi:hypothetical protein|nr:hypothetical protein [Gracilibacteraceae bacterium]
MKLIEWLLGKWIRKKECKCHFGADDILIEDFRLNAVHYLPAKLEKGIELDYYMDTGKDIYLLRLQDSIENTILFINRESVKRNTAMQFTYIIARKKLYDENINKELEKIIRKLKEIKFPKYHEEKTFEIEAWK